MDLESKYGLVPSDNTCTLEKVGIFIYILSLGTSNRVAQERFQHSGETISRIFKEVLDAMDGLSRDLLRPRDPEFKEIPSQLVNDTRYMPYFKDCIGALDGTHIDVIFPEEDQIWYRGRKGTTTINVLAVCDFDLLFTYVMAGWEGFTHDSRIFLDAIGNTNMNFPKPPPGKYYLADKGYPERDGYLTPYHKKGYHQSKFRGTNPRGSHEIFNQAHSSLRSCIERSFGVLKARWKILGKVPKYSPRDQNKIICAAFALHNYIKLNKVFDPGFEVIDRDSSFIPPEVRVMDANDGSVAVVDRIGRHTMSKLREDITASLMANRCPRK